MNLSLIICYEEFSDGFKIQYIANLTPQYFNQNSWEGFWYKKPVSKFVSRSEHSFIYLFRIALGKKRWEIFYFGTEVIITYAILFKKSFFSRCDCNARSRFSVFMSDSLQRMIIGGFIN